MPKAELRRSREEKQIDASSARVRIDLKPYRIAPAKLEPKHLSFRVIMELNHALESFKTMEMSFGKHYRYAETFPSIAQIARELEIDPAEMKVEQLLGPHDDWYRIRSVAVYYEAEVASSLAQKIWSQSAVHALYKGGKIRRARYGIEEIETRYHRWLGGLDDPEQPWIQPSSREEHMAELAFEETLAHALDVDGFRERVKLSPEEMSDDAALEALHKRRVQSKYIPEAAKAASKKWLSKHGKEEDVK